MNPIKLAHKGVVDTGDPDDKVVPHYHTWYCGCQTRLTSTGWEIIYCSETCEFYLIFTGQKE